VSAGSLAREECRRQGKLPVETKTVIFVCLARNDPARGKGNKSLGHSDLPRLAAMFNRKETRQGKCTWLRAETVRKRANWQNRMGSRDLDVTVNPWRNTSRLHTRHTASILLGCPHATMMPTQTLWGG